MDTLTHAIYGAPPADLAPAPNGATQISPLVPGSSPLEDFSPGSLASITMLAPPGTLERRFTLAMALKALAPGAPMVVLAPKDKGGSRLSKELKSLGAEFEEDSRRHHRICRVTAFEPTPEVEAAIQDGSPRFLDSIGFHTQPGVFSWDRIDAGSLLLAEKLPELVGRGADLGAGIGFLSREILKSKKVQSLNLVEIDRRATKMAALNLPASRVEIHWADLRASLLRLPRLDFVVSNPPFHDTGEEDQSLGISFLEKAAEMLRPGGVAWIVANRHLPYESTLKEKFSSVTSVAETGGFKIYKAEK
jgi:16S rRNA (guanine1207-N2)-methyltransferase